jgi:hypothetical protein
VCSPCFHGSLSLTTIYPVLFPKIFVMNFQNLTIHTASQRSPLMLWLFLPCNLQFVHRPYIFFVYIQQPSGHFFFLISHRPFKNIIIYPFPLHTSTVLPNMFVSSLLLYLSFCTLITFYSNVPWDRLPFLLRSRNCKAVTSTHDAMDERLLKHKNLCKRS